MAVGNTSKVLRKLTSSDSAHRLLQKHDVAARDSSMVTTPEICFEAILRVSSKSDSYTKVIQGRCVALLCRRVSNGGGVQPAGATAGIIKGIGAAHSLSLVSGAVQQERSPVSAGNIASGFYHISPSCLETAGRSHIKKSILTVHIEVFLFYYAGLCLAAQNY